MGQACRRARSSETRAVSDLCEPSKMMNMYEVFASTHEALSVGRTAGETAFQSSKEGLDRIMSGVSEMFGHVTETIEQTFATAAPRLASHYQNAKSGKDTDVLQMCHRARSVSLLQTVSYKLPAGLRICILGGTRFNEARSESLVKALAQEIASRIDSHSLLYSAVFFTGGMPGVQETFSNALGSEFKGTLFHLLPRGQSSKFTVGRDMIAGADLSERMDLFASIGEVYICIEGGPGVAKEARDASARRAFVLPIVSTGGASSGKFDFPEHPLRRPAFVSEERWSMITQPVEPKAAATAIVDIVLDVLDVWKDDNNLSSQSFRPASVSGNAVAELMRALKSNTLSMEQLEQMLAIVDSGCLRANL